SPAVAPGKEARRPAARRSLAAPPVAGPSPSVFARVLPAGDARALRPHGPQGPRLSRDFGRLAARARELPLVVARQPPPRRAGGGSLHRNPAHHGKAVGPGRAAIGLYQSPEVLTSGDWYRERLRARAKWREASGSRRRPARRLSDCLNFGRVRNSDDWLLN